MQQDRRIEWIDAYKGIAIILVVIGHATGKFNGYIYQFHVAAFFFISGWVAQIGVTSFLEDVYKKTLTLLLPLLSTVVMFGILTTILKICGVYRYFWDDSTYQTLQGQVCDFLKNGTMINLLGAAWFITVLFAVTILSKFIYYIARNNIHIFLLLTVIVYIVGYLSMRDSNSIYIKVDRVFIAMGYYGLGYYLKRVMPEINMSNKRKSIIIYITLFIVTSVVLQIMKMNLGGKNLSDIANRQMNSFVWTAISAVIGIVWIYAISHIVCVCGVSKLKMVFILLGKNTMGIMLFHFLFFRITAVVLYGLRVVDLEELRQNVPTPDVSNTFWIVYFITSLGGAYCIWRVMVNTPILKQLLGADKTFIKAVREFEPINEFFEGCHRLSSVIRNSLMGEKHSLANTVLFIISIGMIFSVRFIPNKSNEGDDSFNENVVTGAISVTFPYNGKQITFGDGWLEQTESEPYRWVKKEARFLARLSDQTTISMSGYVPLDIPITHVDLFLNGILVVGSNINEEQAFELRGDLSNAIITGENEFLIVFDGERNVTEETVDKRVFSAMFTAIEIQ